MSVNHKPNMIYSPEQHIPLFEVLVTDAGTRVIRVKRNKVYEEVMLDDLLTLIVNATEIK